MAVPYHTHIFEIPTASEAEVIAGTSDGLAVTPASLGNLATLAGVTPGATGLELLADSSDVNARDTLGLGTAAVEDVAAFLQPAAIGSTVQGHSANLDTLAAVTPAAAGTSILAMSLAADVRNFLDTASYVATRTAAKALDTTKETTLILTEAGREGIFYWAPGNFSTQIAADTLEGIYIKANAIASTSGAWVRVYDGLADVRWFGAVLDGTTNISAAIQAAINLVGGVFLAYTPQGFVAGNIDLDPSLGQVIRTERRPTWKLGASHSYAIKVKGSASPTAGVYGEVDAFVFDGSAAPSTSGAILMGTAAGVVLGFRCEGMIAKYCGFAYNEETSASNFVVEIKFGDVQCIFTRGTQINSKRSRGLFFWNDIVINNTYNMPGGLPQVTWPSVQFKDFVGIDFNNMDVVGDTADPARPYQAAAIGVVMDGGAGAGSVYGRRLLVDNTCGPGILLKDLFNLEVDIVQGYQNLGTQIELRNVTKSTISKVKAMGAVGVGNAVASTHGLYMNGCSWVTIEGFEGEKSTGDGNRMTNCSDCKVVDGYAISNTGYGFSETGTATRNLRNGVSSISNTAGSLLQIGAQSATANWWPNSGSYLASTAGAITV